jgi:2-polyprenyl-3-methyl-5-hydroxy-6-metoxy-1,4-benzoquinol methylase
MENYIKLNKQSWNQKVPIHIASDFYANEAFINGANTLNEIELSLLGNVKDKNILHLQCHFGQDSMSLSRMGAKVTGIDFSDVAINKAQELAAQLQLNTNFICTDVYNTPNHLNEKFDIVFTSYGTIGWLPNTENWAQVVSSSLKPGGQFIMADFHPVVWMYNNELSFIEYSYFNKQDIVETTEGTYADNKAAIKNTTISWNHSLSEILNSLIKNGLEINTFNEYDYSPYNCLHNMEQVAPRQYIIKHIGQKIPLVYAIHATKK